VTWYRTGSGLAVPAPLAETGRRPSGIPEREWATLSPRHARNLRYGVSGGAIPQTFMVVNSAMVTTAAPVKVATGTAIKTMLQLKPAVRLVVIEWGASFDGAAAATPGEVELIETDVAATVTASAVADIMPHGDLNAIANTAGTSGTPLNLGTSATGYTASAEGTITTTRLFDPQQVAPTNQYVKQWPLDREPHMAVGKFTRVRCTFPATVNAYTYAIVGLA